MALSHICYFLVVIPSQISIYKYQDWRFGKFACKLSFFTEDFASSSVTLTLCLLGLDRFMSIVGINKKTKVFKTSNSDFISYFQRLQHIKILIFCSWVASISSALPIAMGSGFQIQLSRKISLIITLRVSFFLFENMSFSTVFTGFIRPLQVRQVSPFQDLIVLRT